MLTKRETLADCETARMMMHARVDEYFSNEYISASTTPASYADMTVNEFIKQFYQAKFTSN